MNEISGDQVLRLTDGVVFQAGPTYWAVESLRLNRGELVAFSPSDLEPVVDVAGPLASVLASLTEPPEGTVELFQNNVYRLGYRDLQRLRARIGFVQGFGGLLSANTVTENISLPVSVHGGLSFSEERELVQRSISSYALEKVADFKPHDMDGATRWRVCLARAMILSPEWVVIEGLGDWEMDRGRGIGWQRIAEYHKAGRAAIAICLSRKNAAFEEWFKDLNGEIINYKMLVRE